MPEIFALGVLKGISGSWRDHILQIDHRYGPHQDLAWGRTLCGIKGSVRDPKDRPLTEVVNVGVDICRTCHKAGRRRLDA